MSTLIKSVIKYTFGKKLFTAMMFVIVVFSAIFTAFTFRLGTAFAYDSVIDGEFFKYQFVGASANRLSEDDFAQAFGKFGFDRTEVYYVNYYHTLVAGEYKDSEFHLSLVSSVSDLSIYVDVQDKITEEDVENGRKLLIVDKFTVSDSQGEVDIGKTVYLNGVEYLVVGTEGVRDTDGMHYSALAVESDELCATYDTLNYFVFTREEVPERFLKNFAKENGITATLPEKSKFLIGFFVLSMVVCALFVANLGVLFGAFVKTNAKFYAVFKILGIRTATLVVAACLPCVIVALLGALAGVGTDYAIASITTVLDKNVYLSAGGAVAIVLLNVAGAFAGAAIACAPQAKAMPSDSLRRTE